MNAVETKQEALKKELTDLKKKVLDPKIKADIEKRLKGIDKPVKK